MELKDFITVTLEQICMAIQESSELCEQYGAIVNPNVTTCVEGEHSIPKKPKHINIQRRVQQIELDILLSAEKSEVNSIGGKAGISVFSFGADSSGNTTTSSCHRVKFNIPIALPTTNVIKEDKENKENKEARNAVVY